MIKHGCLYLASPQVSPFLLSSINTISAPSHTLSTMSHADKAFGSTDTIDTIVSKFDWSKVSQSLFTRMVKR